MIESVASEPLKGDPEGVRVTVRYRKGNRCDEIYHSPKTGFSVIAYCHGEAVDEYRTK